MKWFYSVLTLIASLVALGSEGIVPVILHTEADGWLIGVRLTPQFDYWQPIVAIGYGLMSGRLRYELGLAYTGPLITGIERPGISLLDWPATPVLGREGQTGLTLSASLWDTRTTAFMGELWPRGKKPAPQVAFIHGERDLSLVDTPELSVALHGRLLRGWLTATPAGAATFTSAEITLSVVRGDLTLSVAAGLTENIAKLDEFAFWLVIRGTPVAEKVTAFVRIDAERKIPLAEGVWQLLPKLIEVQWQIRVETFVHAALGLPAQLLNSGAKSLFAVGVALIYELQWLALTLELSVDHTGTLHFKPPF